MSRCNIVGIPIWTGSNRRGCDLGPGALRAAGLNEALASLGHQVKDFGDVAPAAINERRHPNAAIKSLGSVAAWIGSIADTAYRASADAVPVFLGGDHAMSAGTISGLARRAAELRRPLFLLWLDSHPDLHTLETSESGNLHGTMIAYVTGCGGFDGYFPPLAAPLRADHICMMGIRSVDPAERGALKESGISVYDMRRIDELGVVAPLREFLDAVSAANGLLHVSFDVDFLDPGIAPAVGTTVAGGCTFREAHLIMEMLHDSGLVTSLDLAELNPLYDERGRTAFLLVDLAASLFGRRVMDRPTRSFGR